MRSLDYLVRVSDKSYYISPTRGQLGNALKCLWARPSWPTAPVGRSTSSRAARHEIAVTLDRIAPSAERAAHPPGSDGTNRHSDHRPLAGDS